MLTPPTSFVALSELPTKPWRILRPSGAWRVPNFREIWAHRELLLALAWRDLRVRYKQTALGAIWVVVQPLLAAGIFSFIFGSVAGLQAPGSLPYFLFTFTGLLGWNAFASLLSRSSAAMVGNAPLVDKVYFARLVLPLSTVLTVLVDFAVVCALLALLLPLSWHLPGWNVALAPVCLLLMGMMGLGIGCAAAGVAVLYRDVLYVVPVLIQLLMWISAVLFPPAEVPERYIDLFYANPLVSLLEAFRWSILGVGEVRWGYFGYAAAASVAVFIGGATAFRSLERRFADVI